MLELFQTRLGDLVWTAPLVGTVLAIAVLLRLLRPRRSRRPMTDSPRRSLLTDLQYLALTPVSEGFSRVASTLVLLGCALLAGRELSPALLDGFGPAAAQPRWLIIVEMLVIGDLMFYWTHRMAHTVPWLWRLHAVHHSARHMRWSSAFRAHPGEAYAQILHMLPLFLLGFPVDALWTVMPFVSLYAMFIHSDLNVSLRPVAFLVNSPGFHRWHHARDIRDGTCNFAGWFPIYDLIFGSYRAPVGRPEALGIDDVEMPADCLGQLAHPFRSHSPAAQKQPDARALPAREPAMARHATQPMAPWAR